MENIYKEIDGNLIELALNGEFDVIVQGNNCFNTQGSGLAPQMVEAFQTDKFPMELEGKGDINKLGQIDFQPRRVYEGVSSSKWNGKIVLFKHNLTVPKEDTKLLQVVNAYTQYNFGSYRAGGDVKAPADYEAITLVMRKINHKFKGYHIGLPKIASGLAGGDWNIIKDIIQRELKDCQITVVNYKPNYLGGGESMVYKANKTITIHKP